MNVNCLPSDRERNCPMKDHLVVRRLTVCVLISIASLCASTPLRMARGAERIRIQVRSSLDGTIQPSYVILPDGAGQGGRPRPLLVSLHTWSGDLEQRNLELEEAARQIGWIYLFPNFRGRNNHPEACGSNKAQQDILDAIEWCKTKYSVDTRRIYLSGNSGGGHMTMLMVAKNPDLFAAASAWVGISDLEDWYKTQNERKSRYARDIARCCGGVPGESAEVDREYRDRSPITFLHRAKNVPLDISAGVHDGHKGSVPIRHSLNAFNAIAKANQTPVITAAEIEQLSRANGHLDHPAASDQVEDPSFGRAIYLRRMSKNARVTIFEGGHEGITTATIEWLKIHARK